MWEFLETVRIEERFGTWEGLITMVKDGTPESFYLNFQTEPSIESVTEAGHSLVATRNAQEAGNQLPLADKE